MSEYQNKLIKESSPEAEAVVSTSSPVSYRYFYNGINSFDKLDYSPAVEWFARALDIDSNLVAALLYLSVSYGNQEMYDEAKKWCLRAYEKREQMTVIQKLYTNYVHVIYFETPYEEIKYLLEIVDIDDQLATAFYSLGYNYEELNQYDKAIQALEKVLEIRKKWGLKPSWIYNYTDLGFAYHKMGKFRKEMELYKKAALDFPDNYRLAYRQAVLALSEGKSKNADEYIEKYKSIRKGNSSEAAITNSLAGIYDEAGILDKAEEYYRNALSLEPENPARLNTLALFLIDNGRDINEGMALSEKALEWSPDNYLYLETKGWGLYKLGKYQEALQMLEKSWNLKPVYDHELFMHLEEVRRSSAEKK